MGANAVPGPVRAAWHTRAGAHPGAARRPGAITADRADRIRDELREFAHLGGFTIRPGEHPMVRRRGCARRRSATAAATWPRGSAAAACRCSSTAAAGPADETGLRPPASYRRGSRRIPPVRGLAGRLWLLDAGVYRGRPGAARHGRGDGAGLSFRERRALRKQARALAVAGQRRPRRGAASSPARSWPRR